MTRRGRVIGSGYALLVAEVALASTVSVFLDAAAQKSPEGARGTVGPPVQARRVLVLYTDRLDLPANIVLTETIRAALATGRGPIDLYTESLDVSRFAGEDYLKAHSDFLRQRYAHKKLDVVITVSDSAIDFLVRYGAGLFPGTPVVVASTERRGIKTWPLPPGITGAVAYIQMKTTFELALALHPATRRVVIVAGTSGIDRYWAQQAEREIKEVAPAVEVIDLGGLAMADILKAVSLQPPHTILFYLHVFRDGAGGLFIPRDVLERIAQVANAPIYGVYDTMLGHGLMGGHLYSFEAQGAAAAKVALRILSGERAEDIPLVHHDGNVYMFDWRQLKRWGIDEGRLPSGAVVRFREPSLWALYRWHIIGTGLLVVTQGALIVSLLVTRARRSRAEDEARRQREELAHVLRVSTLGEMAASLAHEINQPLSAILTNAVAARRLLSADLPESSPAREALEDIAQDARRASQVISRLRALFRREAVAAIPVNVNDLIGDVLGLLRADMQAKHIVVRIETEERVPSVLGDPIQLQQVMLNLLVNACEAVAATEDGLRTIAIETSQSSPERLTIVVRDSGIGIKEAELKRIFEHFVSSKPQGLGMGLAISRSIVEAHGGRIWAAANADGVGLALHVELPCERARNGNR